MSVVTPSVAMSPESVTEKFGESLRAHPRIWFTRGQESAIREKIATDRHLAAIYKLICDTAEPLLSEPPVERVFHGVRMLHVAREALLRIHILAFVYRMTGDVRYADRATAEMLAVAAFCDWDPAQFLDAAELTAAMAIGYDWLYDRLSEADKHTIRSAIIEKGFVPSFVPGQWWVTCDFNWNQVCHGSLTMGALAIADEEPALSGRIIARALENLPLAMRQYGPDGIYSEGPGYWIYGTTYNVMMITALESALGTDFGLAANSESFMNTGEYFLHCIGPTGQWFNYCDCSLRKGIGPAPAMWWFAGRSCDPSLLHNELKHLDAALAESDASQDREMIRFMPLILFWASCGNLPAAPTRTTFIGGGASPLGIFRSSWDDQATFLAIKGGSPGVNHGHMDVGSFVMDAQGIRWAEDLGGEEYTHLEIRKIDLWNREQKSQRWSIFRLGVAAHNVLMVDGQQQIVESQSPIMRGGNDFIVINTSPAYGQQLGSAFRGVRLVPGGAVRIQDEITAGHQTTVIRWAFMTSATLQSAVGGTAVLVIGDKKMALRLTGIRADFRSYCAQGPQDYDAENTGRQMVGFEFEINPGETAHFAVDFVPGATELRPTEITPLTQWF